MLSRAVNRSTICRSCSSQPSHYTDRAVDTLVVADRLHPRAAAWTPWRRSDVTYQAKLCQLSLLCWAKRRPKTGQRAARKDRRPESGSCPCVSEDGSWQAASSTHLQSYTFMFQTPHGGGFVVDGLLLSVSLHCAAPYHTWLVYHRRHTNGACDRRTNKSSP